MLNNQQSIDVNELKSIAKQIEQLETRGADLAHPWYEFDQPQPQDLQELQRLLKSSKDELTSLSAVLDQALRQPHSDKRGALQHAYNLVQELLQSRTANQTLLETMLSDPDKVYAEYLRALALKEKAAAKQAAELVETLSETGPRLQ